MLSHPADTQHHFTYQLYPAPLELEIIVYVGYFSVLLEGKVRMGLDGDKYLHSSPSLSAEGSLMSPSHIPFMASVEVIICSQKGSVTFGVPWLHLWLAVKFITYVTDDICHGMLPTHSKQFSGFFFHREPNTSKSRRTQVSAMDRGGEKQGTF